MTTLIIKSDSAKKISLIKQFVEGLGLSATTQSFEELDVNAMVSGIGRKATDEELTAYLAKDIDEEPINLEKAFSKYLNAK
ncbi:hypothetical protein [Mucilaginibacter flavidus]|uniref:hypothetical protein n=1 Tax=Mucilaginibacter flavidus TaxID=2949309 RepID=UPI0020928150|nr:hypothetical protein [Mucilaginibacter flavidus]MCO5949641.1 hypothetical protein [Mucilaginibacter flavidus]